MPDFSKAREGITKEQLETAIDVLDKLRAKATEHLDYSKDWQAYQDAITLLVQRKRVFYT